MVFIREIRYTNTEERTALFKVPSRTDFQAALRIVPNRNANERTSERSTTRTRTRARTQKHEDGNAGGELAHSLARPLVCTKKEANAIVAEATVGGRQLLAKQQYKLYL